ncbi:hypothetical protein HK099_006168 [Clydaea vesicula]|uniref:C2H2-type domain-containing protein n=1 Tax=Clydaea vesicula TaxID=447962 RepID=A0AAD5XX48_9FUNG|nr:hypothetical protein HK099_006168 [Clydaea vesicula]KAJ3391264.1 hypothetical protein HDU92_009124 [Lobulomyces angularis]
MKAKPTKDIKLRIYPCSICERNFKREEHRQRHLRTHTGERPFHCPRPLCLKRFSRRDELIRHLRKQHNEKKPKLTEDDLVIMRNGKSEKNLLDEKKELDLLEAIIKEEELAEAEILAQNSKNSESQMLKKIKDESNLEATLLFEDDILNFIKHTAPLPTALKVKEALSKDCQSKQVEDNSQSETNNVSLDDLNNQNTQHILNNEILFDNVLNLNDDKNIHLPLNYTSSSINTIYHQSSSEHQDAIKRHQERQIQNQQLHLTLQRIPNQHFVNSFEYPSPASSSISTEHQNFNEFFPQFNNNHDVLQQQQILMQQQIFFLQQQQENFGVVNSNVFNNNINNQNFVDTWNNFFNVAPIETKR